MTDLGEFAPSMAQLKARRVMLMGVQNTDEYRNASEYERGAVAGMAAVIRWVLDAQTFELYDPMHMLKTMGLYNPEPAAKEKDDGESDS